MSSKLLMCLAFVAAVLAHGDASLAASESRPQSVSGAEAPPSRPAKQHVEVALAPVILRTPDGRRFLDVQFAIEAGWHMYWRNPGDSGQPPRLDWTLPVGWSAGEPMYPVPNHLPDDEDTLAFERSLRLLVPVTAPKSWSGDAVMVRLNAQWMTCKEFCVVERQSVQAELVEREGSMPEGYPEPAPPEVSARLQGEGEDRVLVIDASALGGTVRWFPDTRPGVRFPSERMLPMPGGRIEIPVRIRVVDAPDRRPMVRGMVVIDAGSGVRALDIAVPGSAQAAK